MILARLFSALAALFFVALGWLLTVDLHHPLWVSIGTFVAGLTFAIMALEWAYDDGVQTTRDNNEIIDDL